ncbi:MAG: hypothetical protein ACKVTZ_15550, partial [Bacteroidia bacterium]
MKNQSSYTILGIAGFIVLAAAISALKPKDMDWSLSFDKYKKDPFGTYILGQNLKDLFPSNKVLTDRSQYVSKEIIHSVSAHEDFSEDSEEEKEAFAGEPFNYLFLGDDFSQKMAEIYAYDYERIVNLAENGNTILIATEQ